MKHIIYTTAVVVLMLINPMKSEALAGFFAPDSANHRAANIFIRRLKARDYFDTKLQQQLVKSIEKGDLQRMERLVAEGADVNYRGVDDMRPLFWALAKQQPSSFAQLLKMGADPNVRASIDDREVGSVIGLAASASDSTYLAKLLEYGADPNMQLEGSTEQVLYEAVFNRRIANIELLVEAGANLHHQNFSGSTVLLSAVGTKAYTVALKLLELGADPRIKNNWDSDVASRVELFLDRGLVPDSEEDKAYDVFVNKLKELGMLEANRSYRLDGS